RRFFWPMTTANVTIATGVPNQAERVTEQMRPAATTAAGSGFRQYTHQTISAAMHKGANWRGPNIVADSRSPEYPSAWKAASSLCPSVPPFVADKYNRVLGASPTTKTSPIPSTDKMATIHTARCAHRFCCVAVNIATLPAAYAITKLKSVSKPIRHQ